MSVVAHRLGLGGFNNLESIAAFVHASTWYIWNIVQKSNKPKWLNGKSISFKTMKIQIQFSNETFTIYYQTIIAKPHKPIMMHYNWMKQTKQTLPESVLLKHCSRRFVSLYPAMDWSPNTIIEYT